MVCYREQPSLYQFLKSSNIPNGRCERLSRLHPRNPLSQMSIFRTCLHKLNTQHNTHKAFYFLAFTIHKTLTCSFSSSSQPHTTQPNQAKTPLRNFFEEAVGLRETPIPPLTHINELTQPLLELKLEPSNGNKKQKQESSRSLSLIFREKKGGEEGDEEDKRGFKELSPDMEVFVRHLYKEGYFNKANFLRDGRMNFGCFDDRNGRDFIKVAAEEFARDHQDIALWLSGSDLKKIALFGCPSLGRKSIFAAKSLRKFFEIKEESVCSKCVLRHSCKFVNQNVWRVDTKKLNLAVVMRVIILYALEAVHPNLSIPDEIRYSVSQTLSKIIKLGQITR